MFPIILTVIVLISSVDQFLSCRQDKSTNDSRIYHLCNCDEENCAYYGDCCADIDPKLPSVILDTPQCVSLHKDANLSVFMWSNCSADFILSLSGVGETMPFSFYDWVRIYSRKLYEACWNSSVTVPVHTRDGLLFKNVACAYCNNVEWSRLVLPTFILPTCHWSARIPPRVLKPCFDNLVDSCPLESNMSSTECSHNSTSYVICREDSDIVYKNEACMACNRINCPGSAVHPHIEYPDRHTLCPSNASFPEISTSRVTIDSVVGSGKLLSTISLVLLTVFILLQTKIQLYFNASRILILVLSICLFANQLCFLIQPSDNLIESRIANVETFVHKLNEDLLNDSNPIYCYLIMISSLLFNLSCLSFSSILVFDLFYTYMFRSTMYYEQSKRLITVYLSFGFGISCVIVIISYFLFYNNYHKQLHLLHPCFVCQIQSSAHFSVTLTLPTFLSLLINSINCLLLTILIIYSHKGCHFIAVRIKLLILCYKITIFINWPLMLYQISLLFMDDPIYWKTTHLLMSLNGSFAVLAFLADRYAIHNIQAYFHRIWSRFCSPDISLIYSNRRKSTVTSLLSRRTSHL